MKTGPLSKETNNYSFSFQRLDCMFSLLSTDHKLYIGIPVIHDEERTDDILSSFFILPTGTFTSAFGNLAFSYSYTLSIDEEENTITLLSSPNIEELFSYNDELHYYQNEEKTSFIVYEDGIHQRGTLISGTSYTYLGRKLSSISKVSNSIINNNWWDIFGWFREKEECFVTFGFSGIDYIATGFSFC